MIRTEEGVVVWPDPVLDQPCRPVRKFDAELGALLDRMGKVMSDAKGIGIAANQIGVPLRVAIVGQEGGGRLEVVNPEILSTEEEIELEEGCLSVPDEHELCPRYRKVRVRYQDRDGATHELDADGYLAHVFQHEIDHLEGIVYVKRLSTLKTQLLRKRMQKLQKLIARRGDE